MDVSGKHNEFFSGDFLPVSHNNGAGDSSSRPSGSRASPLLSVDHQAAITPLAPQERPERHDADLAMALQLQEEAEQRRRAERNGRRSSGPTSGGNNPPRRPQTGNIPIPLRSRAEARPSIPARTSHAPVSAVNRPSDAQDDDAPPAYEEASRGTPCVPPVGSPLHPSADRGPITSETQLIGTASNTSNASGLQSGVGRRNPLRRSSGFNEMAAYDSPQRLHPQAVVGGAGSARQ